MDEQTIAFLEDAGLKAYVKIFAEQKIGIDEIEHIDAETLPLLIAPIGDQVKYKKALKARVPLENRVESCIIDAKNENLADYELKRSKAFCINSNETPPDQLIELNDLSILLGHDGVAENVFHLQEYNHPDEPAVNNTVETVEETAQSPPHKKVKVDTVDSSNFPSTSSKVGISAPSGTASNKLQSKKELKAFLNECNDGQSVLYHYESNGKLNEAVRRKLTTVIVQDLMVVHGRELKNLHFIAAADVIVEVFPTEFVDAYYIPPQTKGAKQNVSKGKLPYKHRNLKSSMEQKNVKIQGSDSHQATSQIITTENLLSEQKFIESQGWLKSYSEPWTEVLERWAKTAPNRVLHFTKCEDLSITNILKEWPFFKHPLRYTLIATDFKVLYPDKGLELLNGWLNYRDKFIDIMRDRSKKDKHSIGYNALRA